MKHTALSIVLLSLMFTACSKKSIPFGMRRTINQIDKVMNDTLRYDFMIAPEQEAVSKQHFGLGSYLRNEKNLWKGSCLKTYFKLKGIRHPDDMSSILLTLYHRQLNDQPINFKQQKRYYKDYWRHAKAGRDSLDHWRKLYRPVDQEQKEYVMYLANYSTGRKVTGSLEAWKFSNNGGSGRDVAFIGEIQNQNKAILTVVLNKFETVQQGYEFPYQIGDTLEISAYEVYLIP